MSFTPHHGTAPHAQAPGTPPSRRRPGWFWPALACGVLLLVGMLVLVVGGIIYLVVSRGDGGDAPEAKTFTSETFTVQYPGDWTEVPADGGEGGTGEKLEIASPGGTTTVVVYRFSAVADAVTECKAQSVWLGFDWDETGEPEQLDAADVDGRDGTHYRVTGSKGGADMVSEEWCMSDGESMVQVTSTTSGSTTTDPAVTGMLESWTWTEPEE